MKEITKMRQSVKNKRKWYFGPTMELMVWYSSSVKTVTRFELAYQKHINEHIFVWDKRNGFSHYAVDDGEQQLTPYKQSPIMLLNGSFPGSTVLSEFRNNSSRVDRSIKNTICKRIEEFESHKPG